MSTHQLCPWGMRMRRFQTSPCLLFSPDAVEHRRQQLFYSLSRNEHTIRDVSKLHGLLVSESQNTQSKSQACWNRRWVVAARGDHSKGKLKNTFSFEMIRWARACHPGGGLWAVISRTCKPLDDNTSWG